MDSKLSNEAFGNINQATVSLLLWFTLTMAGVYVQYYIHKLAGENSKKIVMHYNIQCHG